MKSHYEWRDDEFESVLLDTRTGIIVASVRQNFYNFNGCFRRYEMYIKGVHQGDTIAITDAKRNIEMCGEF